MKKYIKVLPLLLISLAGCTKLDQSLTGSLTNAQVSSALGTAGVGLLLNGAYADLGGTFTAQDLLFALQENTTDEVLVATRGGDWDDNGVWRVLHDHTWNADHAYVLNVFNSLNKINFDATNVLGFSPSEQQAAEAKFLRALSLYHLLDLYGQYPVRNPGDDLLTAPVVKSGAEGAQFIIDELTAALPKLPNTVTPGKATQDACKTLLMKCYLNRGAWANRAAPTFADADMQQVITLGNSIINSGHYTYMAEYFRNFDANNGSSTENIFTYVNSSGVSANNSGPQGRWCMTLHYNQETSTNPNAGWNGFSTMSDFYNSFGAVTPMVGVTQFNAGNTSGRYADTAIDSRIGGRYAADSIVTKASGQRPGFMIGQQYNEKGEALKDRKGAPLAFDPKMANDQKESGANLEVTGIRVEKYPPDFTDGSKYYQANAGNDIVIMRYADVVLMVAEAKLRASAADAAGAKTLVNELRAARGAQPMTTIPLVNSSNPVDPGTLLAERGRELYWESVRRTDLIRFGVFLKPWQYKPTDNPRYLLMPIPGQSLSSNPNLVQNPGY